MFIFLHVPKTKAYKYTFYYATIAYHVGLNADLGLPHPGPTS